MAITRPARVPKRTRSPKRSVAAALACALVATFGSSLSYADVTFTPSVSAGVSWIDNIELTPPGQPADEELLLELVPSFGLEYKSSRIAAELFYQLTGLAHANDSDRNQAYHEADGVVDLQLVENLFSLEAGGTYFQRTVDPERPSNTSLVFDTNNLADVATYRLTPKVRHEFRHALLDASFTKAWANFVDEDPLQQVALEDADSEQAHVALSSLEDDGGAFSWLLGYDRRRVLYDVSSDFVFENATAELGRRVSARIKVFGRGGVETDLAADPTGESAGLDEGWWQVGAEWRVNRSNYFTFAIGERFFGRSIAAAWDREARVLKLHVGYSEEPGTSAQEMALRGRRTDPDAILVPGDDLSRISSDPYLRRAFDASVRLTGRRTQIELSAYQYRREYLASDLQDREREIGLAMQRQLSSLLTLDASFTHQEVELSSSGSFDQQRASIGLERRIGQRAYLSGQIARIERTSAIVPYEVNWATLTFRKEF